MIVYATKCWNGDKDRVFSYHPDPDLVIGNNLGFKFVDIGETAEPYYVPELRAVVEAHKMGADYILWYAGDVLPPKQKWTEKAIKLLKKYPIASPFWEDNYTDFVGTARREQEKTGFEETDFGFADHAFSDQAYFAKVQTMMDIDYDIDHPIRSIYPPHGGNSFECRVGQWLAHTGKKRAVLKDYKYKHTPSNEK